MGKNSSQRGRSSITGRFETVKKARSHPSTSQVENVPHPGKGASK